MKHLGRSGYVISFIAVSVLTFLLTARMTGSMAEEETPAVRSNSFHGRQVLVILVGSSSCRFSSDPRAKNAFWKIVNAEKERETDSVAISTLGIAIDNSTDEGMETLRAIGQFDEYSVGNGWLGSASLHFVVRDLSGVVMVPQILVVSRAIAAGSPPSVGEDSVHVRLAGVDEIERWANRLDGVRKPNE